MIDTPTRRAVIGAGVFVAGSMLAIDRSIAEAPLAATPACRDGDEATPAQTEGPYFKRSSPERVELLEAGMAGQPIELVGFVLTRDCKPVAGALLDFWQADDKGRYDNSGFRLRGHQFTDTEGRYRLRSVVPGNYPGRTRHIHVKVQPRSGRVLTTQLYFPARRKTVRTACFGRNCWCERPRTRGGWPGVSTSWSGKGFWPVKHLLNDRVGRVIHSV